MYSTNKRSTNQFPFIIITTVNIYLLPVQGPDAVFTPRQQTGFIPRRDVNYDNTCQCIRFRYRLVVEGSTGTGNARK